MSIPSATSGLPAKGGSLAHLTPHAWDGLIAQISPPAMLVAIRRMLSPALRQRLEPEDIWQETLLLAWRDRATCEWRGPGEFRQWLLQIARNRVHDARDREHAYKRGGGVVPESLSPPSSVVPWSDQRQERYAGPVATTTPSRVATDRELAEAMERALQAVPADARAVVFLRLFEDRQFDDVARTLHIGIEAARYRFREGVEVYRQELRRLRVAGTEPAP